jgi:ribosomal protein S18 acetylase RimI-like enzyme
VLNARRGDPAETFYRRLGYREAGVIPGYMIGASGEACDNVAMYRTLAEADARAGSRDFQS